MLKLAWLKSHMASLHSLKTPALWLQPTRLSFNKIVNVVERFVFALLHPSPWSCFPRSDATTFGRAQFPQLGPSPPLTSKQQEQVLLSFNPYSQKEPATASTSLQRDQKNLQ